MKNRQDVRGFTLIELLVVMAILGIVSTVGFTTYGKMTNYWNTLRSWTALERQADTAIENIRKDFGTIISTKLIDARLVGEKSEGGNSVLSFPVESETPGGQRTAALVRYECKTEEPQGGLMRSLSDPLSSELKGPQIGVGTGVSQFIVEYAAADGTWRDTWNESTLPEAVRVNMTLVDRERLMGEQVARKAVFTIHVD
ncbi:MAG: type II secretion system protein [Candidatus Hydrogenedentales bacterium]|jgi:prepilin-type N-terminal cleavage/methylation domain-containing protein